MVKSSTKKYFLLDTVKGLLLSIIIGVILILVMALILKFVPISSGVLTGINQGIKVISIFLGCLFGFKEKRGGIIKGALLGLLYTVCMILIFGLIEKNLSFNLMSALDIGLGLVAGAISGILAVNIGKKA